MRKKRRSRQFKDSSRVINMDEARRARQEKREAERQETRSDADLTPRQLKRKKAMRWKQRRRRIVIGVVIALIVAFGTFSAVKIVHLKMEHKALLEQQEKLEQQKQELQEKVNSDGDKESLEEQARNKLKMILPGETVYAPEQEDTSDEEN